MPDVGRALVTASMLALMSVGLAPAQPASRARAFDSCRDAIAAAPDDYDAVYCVFDAARASGAWDEGLRLLDGLGRGPAPNLWASLVAGHLHRYRQPVPEVAAAESSYLRSAKAFAARGHAEGEILALTNLRDLLMPLGRVADASVHVGRVVEIGRTVTDTVLLARVRLLEATHIRDTGGDLGRAYRLLQQAEQAVFPDGPYRLRRTSLASLGSVAFRLGRLDEATDLFTRLEEMATVERDAATRASARFQVLNTRMLREELLPTPTGRPQLIALARESLALAEAARGDHVALLSHRILADMLSADPATATEAAAHAERCLSMASAARQRHDEAACAWRLAFLTYGRSPDRARSLQRRAQAATEAASTPVAAAMSAGHHMRFAWLTTPPPLAVAESLAALDALETLRRLQDEATRAEAFATWIADYHWLAGRMLQAEAEDAVAGAFSVIERLRARSLLEARQRARAPLDGAEPLAAERRTLLERIAALQRAALEGSSPLDARDRRALADLEGRLHDLDARLAGDQGRARTPGIFADVAAVQRALHPGEAMLSYQLGLWTAFDGSFGGGAWLTVLTSEGRRAYRLPDRVHFAAAVPVFSGLLSGDAGVEAVPAARLWHDVFSTALADLSPATQRLIVIPDGPLHALPFEALRESAAAPPLAVRYEIELAPSATLWLATRGAASPTARALVLADPALPGTDAGAASATRQAWLDRGVALGALPHARRESRAAARRIEGVDRLEGTTASERALKRRDLSGYSVLHVAAHAIADEAAPERSAVVLAAGDEAEDGLLQPREIADLALEGKVVILSACQTASGVVLGGEGVMSLARAFFEAGARAVVGTRWPVGDEGTARFVEMVYDGLGDGLTVSAALGRARRQAIDAGLPPSVWAGIVLLGDGAITPLAPRRLAASRWAVALGALPLVAMVIAVSRRRRLRPTRTPSP